MMRLIVILGISLFLCLNFNNTFAYSENTFSNTKVTFSWLQGLKELRSDFKNCVKQRKENTWSCFKNSTLQIFAAVMSADVINLYEGVRLIRITTKTNNINNSNKKLYRNNESVELEEIGLSWFEKLAQNLEYTLQTHMLEVNFKKVIDSQIIKENNTARYRRHRFNMIITMMFGVTALGSILVPMGFQFLSVVSGKALLLAKMALLLASINGLKRVANTGLHYGLYHVPNENYGAYYERGDVHHPRNVANTLSEVQPYHLDVQN